MGNHFSSIAQLNACGNLQMTELSSLEGGGRVRQKVFLCLVLTSGKPNYHQHSSGLCRSIRRPTPPENIIHIIVETESWFLFFLSGWWSVSCRAVWVWGREKVKTGGLSIHRGVRLEKKATRSTYRVQSTKQYGDLTLFANNSGLCVREFFSMSCMKASRGEEIQKGYMHNRDGWHDVLPGSRRNIVRVWLTWSISPPIFPFRGTLENRTWPITDGHLNGELIHGKTKVNRMVGCGMEWIDR